MQYNSNLSPGDKAFAIQFTLSRQPIIAELTVGKVIIEHTDSPGRIGEELFDNYKPQRSYVERYMCVETGIGSGSVWEYGKNIFKTREECEVAILTIHGWHIKKNIKPIPDRNHDYDFYHNNYDEGSNLCGTAGSVQDAIRQIHEIMTEEAIN